MDIADLITPDRVVANLRAVEKRQVLKDCVRHADVPDLDQETILDALLQREQLGSTGVGGGIALPHARIGGLDRFIGLFARLDRPVEFEAVDERPVDLVFLLLVPANATNEHLQALACVSRRLRDRDVAARLRRAGDATEMYGLLVGATSPAQE